MDGELTRTAMAACYLIGLGMGGWIELDKVGGVIVLVLGLALLVLVARSSSRDEL